MHLEGQFRVGAGKTQVYEFLTDPHTVSRYMPDVKEVDVQDQDHFSVKAKVGISHIKGDMVMKLTITDRNPPISTTVIGKGSGLASMVDMVTSFNLDGAPDGSTLVNWRGDVNVSGKLAAFGPQGLLDRVGRQNVDKFIAGIKGGIESTHGLAPMEVEPAAEAPPPRKAGWWVGMRAAMRAFFRRLFAPAE